MQLFSHTGSISLRSCFSAVLQISLTKRKRKNHQCIPQIRRFDLVHHYRYGRKNHRRNRAPAYVSGMASDGSVDYQDVPNPDNDILPGWSGIFASLQYFVRDKNLYFAGESINAHTNDTIPFEYSTSFSIINNKSFIKKRSS